MIVKNIKTGSPYRRRAGTRELTARPYRAMCCSHRGVAARGSQFLSQWSVSFAVGFVLIIGALLVVNHVDYGTRGGRPDVPEAARRPFRYNPKMWACRGSG